MRSPWHDTPGRRARWYALIVALVLLHLVGGLEVSASLFDDGGEAEPRAIEVNLVKPLMPSAPPAAPAHAAAATAARGRRPPGVRVRAAAASSPQEAASASASHAALRRQALALAASLEAQAAASAAEAAASAASATEAAASAPVVAAASAPVESASSPLAATSPALDWPPSTRLVYRLSGLLRNGPLYGDGVVEWRRDGTHYQVQFDFSVPPFLDAHLLSDGQITPDGLEPAHYDERRKIALQAPRIRRIEFLPDEVVLSNGERPARLPQTQDPSSQFVQFVWMFTLHPQWLRPGNVVSIPLALPNKMRIWHYRVEAPATLLLPFGPVEAVHLVPIDPRQPNELAFELWIAPSLRYLPVRIHVPLNEQNFADLTLATLPLQAADAAPTRPLQAPAPMSLP